MIPKSVTPVRGSEMTHRRISTMMMKMEPRTNMEIFVLSES